MRLGQRASGYHQADWERESLPILVFRFSALESVTVNFWFEFTSKTLPNWRKQFSVIIIVSLSLLSRLFSSSANPKRWKTFSRNLFVHLKNLPCRPNGFEELRKRALKFWNADQFSVTRLGRCESKANSDFQHSRHLDNKKLFSVFASFQAFAVLRKSIDLLALAKLR